MSVIIRVEKWHNVIYSMWIKSPQVAMKVQPGQFVILMIDEKGERIPLTVADYHREEGWIQVVFQTVGTSTMKLAHMSIGDELFSFVGPLGKPSEIEKYGTVITIGGGTGIACVHPITRALKEAGNKVIAIIGARTKELIIMEEKMKEASTELHVTTDDGSYIRKGFVTDVLREVLQGETNIRKVWAIGPAIMMKFTCAVAKPFGVEVIVSLNAIMVDGTGMCGSCRVTVDGQTKHTCVDGPEFNGHLVEWEEFMNRLTRYTEQEKLSLNMFNKQCQRK
jgi:NAD(P)H-flavin reductase